MNIQINVAVDTVAALSEGTLAGNMCLMDDSIHDSENQGSTELVTHCMPGQLITWIIYPVDLQTPVSLEQLEFLPGEAAQEAAKLIDEQQEQAEQAHAEYLAQLIDCDTPEKEAESQTAEAADAKDDAEHSHSDDEGPEELLPHVDPDARVWSGYTPSYLVPGEKYFYRLTVKMGEGKYSTLICDSASIMIPGQC